ncbi:MAG TPA: ATP-binding protein [Saprospiraceae bacterium]|nr:ATP-binding protein [Saprospiraceae bacterium]HMQ82205.1 ATP-binding protein [Saprospiraceae bacterium]
MQLVGRIQERAIFNHCLRSTESKLIALYGRRRVGKTFLVRKHFDQQIVFEIAGLYNGEMKDQLQHFALAITKKGWAEAALYPPKSWKAAFDLLERYLDAIPHQRKKVIFLDELPWFDTPRSKFIMAFENFWNAYCTRREDIVCVICGSAASWMLKKILKNKGGLHNRVSEKIRLKPFNLYESEQFLNQKGILWSRYDIAQLYLSTGGIPFYLDSIRKGESVVQFIDRACFSKDGILRNEYTELFHSLFDNSERHYKIVETLYNKKEGLTREEIIDKSGLPSGGTLSITIDELEESGFIETQIQNKKQKSKALYKLVDHFTIFYLKFMKSNATHINQKWGNIVKTQSWISWSGLAFERLCFAHLSQIIRALRLEAIGYNAFPYVFKGEEDTVQIDMLIDRADRIVNLCEIKFTKADFIIDTDYARQLRNKLQRISERPENKRKNIFLTMITTFGVADNAYYKELVQAEIVLDDLFTSD